MLRTLISKSCSKCIFHEKSTVNNLHVCKKFREYSEKKDIYRDTLVCYHFTDDSIIKYSDFTQDNLSILVDNKINEDYLSVGEARKYFCGLNGVYFLNKNE